MPAILTREQESSGVSSPSPATVRSILPDIGITAKRIKQINSVLLIRAQREQRKQEVAFNARPFVLCGIPLRPVPKDQLVYKRRNGNFFLHIVGHPDFGIATVRDRVVQAALRAVLEPILERDFAAHSYGFRPNRGCKDALRRVDALLKAGYHGVVDADLKSYFDAASYCPLRYAQRFRIHTFLPDLSG